LSWWQFRDYYNIYWFLIRFEDMNSELWRIVLVDVRLGDGNAGFEGTDEFAALWCGKAWAAQ